MIDRRTRLWLLDMRDHARLAIDFLGDLDAAALLADHKQLFALNRAIEIVGEAARRVDPAQHAQMPNVPWRQAIDFRNRLIHGYDTINVEIVVGTVRNDFPALIAEIDRILNTGGSGQV